MATASQTQPAATESSRSRCSRRNCWSSTSQSCPTTRLQRSRSSSGPRRPRSATGLLSSTSTAVAAGLTLPPSWGSAQLRLSPSRTSAMLWSRCTASWPATLSARAGPPRRRSFRIPVSTPSRASRKLQSSSAQLHTLPLQRLSIRRMASYSIQKVGCASRSRLRQSAR